MLEVPLLSWEGAAGLSAAGLERLAAGLVRLEGRLVRMAMDQQGGRISGQRGRARGDESAIG